MKVSVETYEGLTATREEMTYADWKSRLDRAKREAKEGKRMPLDTYVKRRSRR